MRLRDLAAVVVLVSVLFGGVVQASSGTTGSLILFLGGVEAGSEDYWVTGTEFRTDGTISISGQTLKIASSLMGSNGQWKEYAGVLSPGASFSARFTEDSVDMEVGPLKRSFPLQKPFVVLDNNVFAHYEQVLHLIPEGQDQTTVSVVVPSLILSNQSPVLQGEVKSNGKVYYQTNSGEIIPLDEYILTMAGSLQVRVLGLENELISSEIPMQGVQVVKEEFIGLKAYEAKQESASHLLAEDFFVKNGAVTLAGTLSLPLGEGPFPVVLLNSGSGPQDRHGNTPPSFMTNMFTIMAEKLTEVGFAVLSYDERGVGESTGDYNGASLEDLLSDIEALLDYLAEHPQIDQSRVGMLGHSEGAYFAPILAERLHAMVLLAGSSITLDQLMIEQLEYQMEHPLVSPQEREMLGQYVPLIEALISEAREGKDVSEVLPMNLEWLRQHMELSPLETLAKVKAPVLIVQGDEDVKVMPYHAKELETALQIAGNEDVQVHYLAGTTHEFVYFPYDNEDFDPLDPMKLNPELFEIVASWVVDNL